MNVIEQTVKAENGAINLHIPVPESLNNASVQVVVVYVKAEDLDRELEVTGLIAPLQTLH